MEIVYWIIFGALAGWVASIFMKTDASQGTLYDIILGIVGAVVGGFFMNNIGKPGITGFNLYSFLVAVIGAIVVIFVGRLVRNR